MFFTNLLKYKRKPEIFSTARSNAVLQTIDLPLLPVKNNLSDELLTARKPGTPW
jgi:hypothetical protein